MKRKLFAALVISALMLTACTMAGAQANLLANPSIEGGFTGWARNNTQVGWSSAAVNAHTGTGAVISYKANTGTDTTPFDMALFQNITLIGGQEYEASAWFKHVGNTTKYDGPGGWDQWSAVRVEFFSNSARTDLVSTVFSPGIDTKAAYAKSTVRFVAPTAAVYARFSLFARVIDGNTTANIIAYSLGDDASLTVVPEPGSILALFAGLTGLVACRRRK